MSRHEPQIVLIAGVWLAAAAAASAATEATSPPGGLEEVIVTAQKRSENEQTVPLSITTFSATALQQKAITEFFDYATKVPNLAFAPTGDGVGTARTIAIRGITGIAGDGTTGFYIDDVPLPDSLDPRVFDIDHIEVLRGPQGTLYGARSMGGTVRLITQTPDLSHFSATVHGGVSDTDHTDRPNYTADAVVNIPLVQDVIALRVSGFYDDEAGYFKRSWCTDPATAGVTCFPLSTTGRTTMSNVAAIDTYGGSASLTIKAGDAVTITPRVMMQRANYNGLPLGDFNVSPQNGIGFPVPSTLYNGVLPSPLTTTDLTQARFFDIPEGGSDWWDLYSLTVHWTTGVGELVSSTAYFDRTVDETEDESEFVWAALLGGGIPPSRGPIEEIKDYQSFVQEIRFASTLSGPLQFVIGGFYSDFHGRIPFASLYPPALYPGIDNVFNGGQPGNALGVPDLIFQQDYHTDIQEPAAFGELYYNFTPALKATVGLRWYQVKATSHGFEAGYATGGFDTVIGPEATTKENGTNPKFELDYQFAPDQMVYGLASKGFRPGGVVPIVPPGSGGNNCVTALAAVNPDLKIEDTRSYKSDSLWNYEIGTKNTLLDHRLILNAAAFDIRWSNIQQQILLGCGFQFISNAGAAESKGGELDLRWRATDRLEASLGLGYQDAKITEKGNSPQPVGSPVFQVPDWTGNGALTYTLPLTSKWNSVSVVDYSYVGSSYSSNNQQPRKRPAYRLLNARIAFGNGATEFALVGKNLTNEVVNLSDNRSIAAEVPGRPRLFLNQPRTIGIEFTQHF
jgi:outer membrane receptor protein involved in Fe transport